ncbi:MAG: tetratricopeptide repeat protein, partial [Bacteroidota bacterium]
NEIFKNLSEAFPQNISYKNSLAISYQNLGNIQVAFGRLDEALNYYEIYNNLAHQVYSTNPKNAKFKNGLATSYSKLGYVYNKYLKNPVKAKDYFQKCHTLWQELTEAHPSYVEFKDNFDWVKKQLASL